MTLQLSSLSWSSCSMITSNVFQRTFFIKFGDSTGTAFAIDIDNRQYLVTARHVIEGIGETGSVEVYHCDEWKKVATRTVGMGAAAEIASDIAVLAPAVRMAPPHPLEATSEGLVWGQSTYFLGFPYGLHTVADVTNGYPLPIVKGAIMSGTLAGAKPHEVYLLDGHNNPGFSGGPAVFRPAEKQGAALRVLGVVSAYKTEEVEVTMQGQQTGLASRANTGIVVCPSIKQATDMIEANPIGFELPTD